MTDIQRFIGRIRDHYLVGFCKEIDTYNRTFHQSTSEILVELEGQEYTPPIFHLHRVDISSNSNSYTDFTEFKTQDNIYFRPTKLSLNNQMKISLEPFVWNEVDFECSAFDVKARLLQKWAFYWLHDHKRRNDYGLTGCVHGLTFPQQEGGYCHFKVDFGSAEVQSFVELLQVLRHLGVRRTRVYSRSFYQ